MAITRRMKRELGFSLIEVQPASEILDGLLSNRVSDGMFVCIIVLGTHILGCAVYSSYSEMGNCSYFTSDHTQHGNCSVSQPAIICLCVVLQCGNHRVEGSEEYSHIICVLRVCTV